MPRQRAHVLPSPGGSLTAAGSYSSRKSEKPTASVEDTNYRHSLGLRNIYIQTEDPPLELMHRAREIISLERASPEMDDCTAQKLRDITRRVEDESEDEIIRQLAPHVIPAINTVPDGRLARNSNQLWYNSVPVPLDPKVLIQPLPLPLPKPNLAFGYSQAAFNKEQLTTIDLLVDDQFGCSFAVPDQKLLFPFLAVEFKSQAENGTLYVATNQVASAGAIAMNANMKLQSRSFGLDSFDFDEPQFFSVTLDNILARVNVHWIRNRTDGEPHSFHLEKLSTHLLDDAHGVRSLRRAIKNILDYGSDIRLPQLCAALHAYREAVIAKRETATTDKNPGDEAQSNAQPEQPRRSKRAQRPSRKQAEGMWLQGKKDIG